VVLCAHLTRRLRVARAKLNSTAARKRHRARLAPSLRGTETLFAPTRAQTDPATTAGAAARVIVFTPPGSIQ